MSDDQNTIEDVVVDGETISYEEASNAGGVPVTQQLLLVGGIFLLIFGSVLTPKLYGMLLQTTEPPETTSTMVTKPPEETSIIKPFAEVEIVGKAAYVWDVNAQRALFKKNEDERLPLASVTKLMTALLAEEILAEDSAVMISDRAIEQDGDSGLLSFETFKRQALSDLVLISSSNDGAYALATAAGEVLDSSRGADAFIDAMNIRADELGLTETSFYNPTGLDVSTTQAGAYGSARDISFLMEYIVEEEPAILAYTQSASAQIYSEDGFSHDAENTNYYLDEIPGLLGSKTGYTDLAGGNLVIAYDAGLNRAIIITVLGSTHQHRFTDVVKLIQETNRYLSQ